MKPLIDGDILLYEIGSCGQYVDEEREPQLRNFEFVRELMDNRIEEICRAVEATSPPIIYLTGKGNFREQIAKRKGYKATREGVVKPYHYANLKAYLLGRYRCVVSEGCEADDMMATEQTACYLDADCNYAPLTIICTRDKDLRMVPGWHYGWECGEQPSFGPVLLNEIGYLKRIEYPEGHKHEGKLKKLEGGGLTWFYTQLLMGDAVDNIPGLPGCGPEKAWKLLGSAVLAPDNLFRIVKEAYQDKYGDSWREEMEEQGRLLWMVRQFKGGKPVIWSVEDFE